MFQRLLLLILSAALVAYLVVYFLPGNNHLEHCTPTWTYSDGKVSTRNICSEEVIVRFMATGNDLQVVEQNLKLGDTFRTTVARTGWWMFTVCPVGHVSSVSFLPENREPIKKGHYDCVRE